VRKATTTVSESQAAFLPPPCPRFDLALADFLEPEEMLRTLPLLFFEVVFPRDRDVLRPLELP